MTDRNNEMINLIAIYFLRFLHELTVISGLQTYADAFVTPDYPAMGYRRSLQRRSAALYIACFNPRVPEK